MIAITMIILVLIFFIVIGPCTSVYIFSIYLFTHSKLLYL